MPFNDLMFDIFPGHCPVFAGQRALRDINDRLARSLLWKSDGSRRSTRYESNDLTGLSGSLAFVPWFAGIDPFDDQ